VISPTGLNRSSDENGRPPKRGCRKITLLAILLLGALVGFASGQYLASIDLQDSYRLMREQTTKGQELKKEIVNKDAEIQDLKAKLSGMQSSMMEMTPAENTYNIGPNQSVITTHGLTVGMVGPPVGDSIILNLNGKHFTAFAGDVVKNLETGCVGRVQSFDMFKAVVTVTCPKAKAQ